MSLNLKTYPIVEDYLVNNEIISRGKYGNIISVINKSTKQKYALKIFKRTAETTYEINLQFKFSLNDSSNILKFQEVFKTNNYFFVVMDLIEGSNLMELILKKQLTESEIKKIMLNVFSAIQHLHTSEIVHGEIKPENILISSNMKKVKLTGFSMAIKANTKYVNYKIAKKCDSPLFMAPELVKTRNKFKMYDLPNDIWSLGILLLILFYEQNPYYTKSEKTNSSDLRKQIKNGNYRIIETRSISNEAKILINSMLILSDSNRADINKILNSKWLQT